MNWGDQVPADVVLERKVDAAIADGHPLPRWGFPVPGPYNGATGPERIYVWQQNRTGQIMGLLQYPSGLCTACNSCKA